MKVFYLLNIRQIRNKIDKFLITTLIIHLLFKNYFYHVKIMSWDVKFSFKT